MDENKRLTDEELERKYGAEWSQINEDMKVRDDRDLVVCEQDR